VSIYVLLLLGGDDWAKHDAEYPVVISYTGRDLRPSLGGAFPYEAVGWGRKCER
jgi:hypothetical protein